MKFIGGFDLNQYAEAELKEALKTFRSSISKCEKAQGKLKDGSWQKAFTQKQLAAFYIAVNLIENAHENENRVYFKCTNAELQAAGETLQLLTEKCKDVQAKFKDGSPQKTLADRRLKAFDIASSLLCGSKGNV